MKQAVPQVLYTRTRTSNRDQQRLAYQCQGSGPVLIQTPLWMGHLEHDDDSPMAGALARGLAHQHQLVRYDQRGCGLSDRWTSTARPADWVDDCVDDLEAVVEAVGAERFALLGVSQGAAIAIAYAARQPQRVSRLVLHGGYARGRLVRDVSVASADEAQTLVRMAELGWGRADEAFRQVFTTQLIPGGSRLQQAGFNELQRQAASPSQAASLMRAFDVLDVSALLPQVHCPALVLHSRHDWRVPFDEGRTLAGGLADAEFVSIESVNHLLLETEPAWQRWLALVRAFLLPEAQASQYAQLAALMSLRQRSLVELMARGLGNEQIAAALQLSEKTVRNQVTAVFERLCVENRGQAIVRLRESGFGQAHA